MTSPAPSSATPFLTITDVEHPDVESSQLLQWVPKTPVRLAKSDMPWKTWAIDRFVAWVPEDPMEMLEDGTEKAAGAVLKDLNSYSFDGEMAFIPGAHAERFWAFLTAYFQTAVADNDSFDYEGTDIAIDRDLLSVGDGTTGVFGMRTDMGLWLVFAESDSSFGTDFIRSVAAAYPDADALGMVNADAARTIDEGVSDFDPNRAWSVCDCHLADHLYPARADKENDDAFYAFLSGAIADGALDLDGLVSDMGDLEEALGGHTGPGAGKTVAVVGADPKQADALVRLVGGTRGDDISQADCVVVARGATLDPKDVPVGAVVLSQADVVRTVLEAHTRRNELPPVVYPSCPGR